MTNNTVLYSDDETTKKKTSYIQKSLIQIKVERKRDEEGNFRSKYDSKPSMKK